MYKSLQINKDSIGIDYEYYEGWSHGSNYSNYFYKYGWNHPDFKHNNIGYNSFSKTGGIEWILKRVDSIKKIEGYADENGNTPLHFLIFNEKGIRLVDDWKDKINILHECQDINAKNTKGETALHLATFVGNSELIIDLIKFGANINTSSISGDTPLHNAMHFGRDITTMYLLLNGGNPNILNGYNERPTDIANYYNLNMKKKNTSNQNSCNFDKCIFIFKIYDIKSKKIQRYFREARYNPKYKLCRKMLLDSYNKLFKNNLKN